MGLLDGLLSRLGYTKAVEKIPEHARLIAERERYSLPDAETYIAQATLYQKLTWIATAIDILSEAAAIAKFSVKQKVGEEDEDIPNHPFELLLQNPNPMQSEFEFKRDYFAYRKLTGNVYVYLNRESENDIPSELWIIPTHLIKPIPDGNSYIKGYLFDEKLILEPWQVMHDKTFNPLNPFIGMSAIESLAIVARGDIAQQAYTTKLFDKDNAKIPGAIAFADMINDTDWQQLQRESKAQWGGMNRSGPMWLRGVGAGGVQWLQMALSQKEMEFLEQRQFTKEEIWSKLVPGLASVLAVNATEANALAGKAIMAEYAIWPMLTQAAQKISKDILPSYGDDLCGEFDDIRKADRLIDLQEQQEYAKTHTVNEIRAEHYGDDPIEGGDVPVEAWVSAAKPQPVMQPGFGGQAPADEQKPDEAMNANAEAEQSAELKAWENFAIKRIGKQAGRDFIPRAIPIMQAARIRTALKSVSSVDDVRTVFDAERNDVGHKSDERYLADALLAAAEAVRGEQ